MEALGVIAEQASAAWSSTTTTMLLENREDGSPLFFLTLYILWVAQAVHAVAFSGPSPASFFSFNVRVVLAGFGGGIIVPFLLGHTVVPLLKDEIPILVYASCFLLAYCPQRYFGTFLATWPARAIVGAGFQVFRVHTIFAMANCAFSAIPAETLPFPPTFLDAKVPLFAPIICGTLGGCGGMFLPLSDGLSKIDTKAGPIVSSAALYSAVYCLVTRGFDFLGLLTQGVFRFDGEVDAELHRTTKLVLICVAILAELYVQQITEFQRAAALQPPQAPEQSKETATNPESENKSEPEEEPETVQISAPTPTPDKSVEKMSHKELCKLCKQEGFTGYSKLKKDQLIRLLNNI